MTQNFGLRFALLAFLGRAVIPFIGSTLRLTVRKEKSLARLQRKGGRVVYAIWHGRMLGLILTQRGKCVSALISQHRDGDYIAKIAQSLGFNPIRGSTAKSGARALKEMVREGVRGRDLAVTPDGPRGPVYRAKMGVVKLAQLTKMPMVPVAFSSSRALVFKSWDRFLLPLPFSRCVILFGAPIWADSATELDAIRVRLEESLTDLNAEAEKLC